MAEAAANELTLPAIVDLDVLDQVRDQLIDLVEHDTVTVKADAVERVSTNALFMLLSAAESARRNTRTLVISKPSQTLLSAVERLGLDARFAPLFEG
jgi:anti-anti-sigma regulatory factor